MARKPKHRLNQARSDSQQNLQIDAAEPGEGKRRRVAARIQSLDDLLTPPKRTRVTASTRFLDHNFAIAAWAIRRHLDYISIFNFQPRSGDDALDRDLAEMVADWSRPDNWDAGGRHSRSAFLRILEGRSVIDGDCGVYKLDDFTVQGVEGDRIRQPAIDTVKRLRLEPQEWKHGVRIDRRNRAVAYAVHSRSAWGGYTLEQIVPARLMHLVGYFTGFDQRRGSSPLMSAVNSFQDVYESLDMALIKQKVAQILALVTYRDDAGSMGHRDDVIDFSAGPVHLNFDHDDKAEIIESRNPSSETQAFWITVIQIALKSLDLPFSFYDESFTNFFGSRAAFIHYERSARSKRDRLENLLDQLTAWRLAGWYLTGDLVLPRSIPLSSIDWQWTPLGTEWWNPVQEITADVAAIEAGLMTRAEVRKKRFGDDWRPVAAALGEEQRWLEEHGVATSFAAKTELMEMIHAENASQ